MDARGERTQAEASAPDAPTVWYWVALAVCLVILAAVMLVAVPGADTIYDEGGYLYEGWMVVAHGWRPYADFHTKTLPLLYYLYGIGQAVFGPSVLVGRLEATLFALLTLLMAARLAARLSSRWAAVIVVALFAFNLHAAVAYYRALAMAPTACFFVLALYLAIADQPRPWRLYLAALAATALVLCRHDMILVAVVIWLYLCWRHRSQRGHVIAAVAVGIALLLAVCLRFYVLAPFKFVDVILAGRFAVAQMSAPYGEAVGATPAAIAWHLMMFLRWHLAVLLLLTPAAGYLLWRAGGGLADARLMLARHSGIALLLGAVAVNYLAHLFGSSLFGLNVFYLLDFYIFFPLAAAAAAGFMLALRAAGIPQARAQLAALGIVAVLVPLLVSGLPDALSGRRPPHLQQVTVGAKTLKRLIPPEATVFTLDDPHLFLVAGIELPPELTHQLFLFAADGDPGIIRARHYYDRQMIDEWLSGEADYAVIGDDLVEWLLHSGRYPGGEALYDFISTRLEANYTLLETVPGSYLGPTRIYRFSPKHP